MDNNLVGWYRTMQLGHFSEGGVKTEGGMRSQRTLFDCPQALAVRGADGLDRSVDRSGAWLIR